MREAGITECVQRSGQKKGSRRVMPTRGAAIQELEEREDGG